MPFISSAAEINYLIKDKKVLVNYTGKVTKGDFKKLRQVFKKNGYITEVRLKSPGGNLYEAFKISKFLREKNIMTKVKKGDMCFSACFDIFIGGILRSVAKGGKLGSHMHSLPTKVVFGSLAKKFKHIKSEEEVIVRTIKEVEQLSAIATARRVRNLIDMGVNYRAIDPLIETSFFETHFYEVRELKRYNITNIEN